MSTDVGSSKSTRPVLDGVLQGMAGYYPGAKPGPFPTTCGA